MPDKYKKPTLPADITAQFKKLTLSLRVQEDMHPFEQKPCLDHDDPSRQRVNAHELFSLFTAGIIKKQVTFYR